VLVSTLREVAAAAPDVPAPAIVVVGPVVRLRPKLDWNGTLEEGNPL
jgi:siroheme synthase